MRTYLKKQIARLEALLPYPDDPHICEAEAVTIREAADKAAQAGHLDFYRKYRYTQATTPRDAVAILSSLLATLQPNEKQGDQGPDKGPFSIEQAAARLGISKSKAYQDARAGLLPHKRIGRRIVVDLDQLNIYRANIEDEPPTIPTTFRHLP